MQISSNYAIKINLNEALKDNSKDDWRRQPCHLMTGRCGKNEAHETRPSKCKMCGITQIVGMLLANGGNPIYKTILILELHLKYQVKMHKNTLHAHNPEYET